MRSSSPLLTLPSILIHLSLIVAAAQALNEPQTRDAGPAVAAAPTLFQQLCHASTSYLALIGAVIRRKYQTTLHGQLSFVDMVQLIALCSIAQGIRLWRKRSLKHTEQSRLREAGYTGRKAVDSTKASSQIPSGSSRSGGFRWRMHGDREILMQGLF